MTDRQKARKGKPDLKRLANSLSHGAEQASAKGSEETFTKDYKELYSPIRLCRLDTESKHHVILLARKKLGWVLAVSNPCLCSSKRPGPASSAMVSVVSDGRT